MTTQRAQASWRAVKPGWYLLALLVVYSVVATVQWRAESAAADEYRRLAASRETEPAPAPVSAAPEGLWFPVVGAQVPDTAAYLPGAPRSYRQGVNQGFDFYSFDAGIPIPHGTPVIAAADGVVVRADTGYQEPPLEAWQALMTTVAANGATEAQLDRLRGRQVWIRTDDGRILRYGHLSGIRPGIVAETRVYRGQVIGYVGNSGTDDGVAGREGGSRLHFEIWLPDGSFWGQDLTEQELRIEAASLFVGP